MSSKQKGSKRNKKNNKKENETSNILSQNQSEKELANLEKELNDTEVRKKKRGNRRLSTKAHRAELMKMHLRSDDMKDEIIEYSVDHPNRVSVRMEYLMQTTKARVNDREFMNTLYQRLVAEENKALAGTAKIREWQEKDRVKKLVIDGTMDPPADMKDLSKHPVFRINKLVKRLLEFERGTLVRPQALPDITPVEPYEFDGDQFFRHLHQNGTYWIPPEEQLAEQERMAGKIARAKLRYFERKYKEAETEKLMKMVYSDKLGSKQNSDEDIIQRKPNEPDHKYEERKRKYRIAKVKSQLFKETERRAAAFRRRREILEEDERIRKEKAERRKRERDVIFLGDRDHERKEYLSRFLKNVATKTVIYKRDSPLMESEIVVSVPQSQSRRNSSVNSQRESRSKPISVEKTKVRKKVIDYKKIFQPPDTPPTLQEEPSFTRLREAFHVRGGNKLSMFKPSSNPVFQKYIDVAETMDELTENSTNLTQMFIREQHYTDKAVIKLRRLDLQYKGVKS